MVLYVVSMRRSLCPGSGGKGKASSSFGGFLGHAMAFALLIASCNTM